MMTMISTRSVGRSVGRSRGSGHYFGAVAACLNVSRLGLSNVTQQRVKRLRSRHSFAPWDCSSGKRPAVHSVAIECTI